MCEFFFFQAEDGIRDLTVTGVQTCALPISGAFILTLLVLPTVIIAAREGIRAVPGSIREGAYALGATKWQVVWRQVLPRSEERRVGKGVDLGGRRIIEK